VAIIESRVDTSSEEYAANRAHYEGLLAALRARMARAERGGDDEAIARHRARGKLLARERIARLLDPGARSWSSVRSRPRASTPARRPPPAS